MGASVGFSETNGVGATVTDGISNINFASADIPNANTTTYPVTVGGASFEKYIRAKFTGVFTTISNILFWKSAGTLVTGETIKASVQASYTQPVQTTNADSDVPTSSGSALALNSMEGVPTIVYGATGVSGYTEYVRLQTHTTGSTPSGAGNTKTFELQWDEV